jgi:hypothetical protein
MSKISYSSLEEVWGNSFQNNDSNIPKQNNNLSNNSQSNMNNVSNSPSNNTTHTMNNINNQQNQNMNNQQNQNLTHYNRSPIPQTNQIVSNREIMKKDFQGIQDNQVPYHEQPTQMNVPSQQPRNSNTQVYPRVDMNKVINNMNMVERNKEPENTINDEYYKYRFNPLNKVMPSTNDTPTNYTPFQENIEKKFLQDKIIELENEFRKYKLMLNSRNNQNYNDDYEQNTMEGFSNQNSESSSFMDSNKNDILDLIVVIIIGLIIIFILDSIFKIGKKIGSRG